MNTIYLRITHEPPGHPHARRTRFVKHQYEGHRSPQAEVAYLNLLAADRNLNMEYALCSVVEYHAFLLSTCKEI
jgi:hypothetical protein